MSQLTLNLCDLNGDCDLSSDFGMCEVGAYKAWPQIKVCIIIVGIEAGVVYSFSVLKRKIISIKEKAFLDKEFHRSPALIDLFSFSLVKIGKAISINHPVTCICRTSCMITIAPRNRSSSILASPRRENCPSGHFSRVIASVNPN